MTIISPVQKLIFILTITTLLPFSRSLTVVKQIKGPPNIIIPGSLGAETLIDFDTTSKGDLAFLRKTFLDSGSTKTATKYSPYPGTRKGAQKKEEFTKISCHKKTGECLVGTSNDIIYVLDIDLNLKETFYYINGTFEYDSTKTNKIYGEPGMFGISISAIAFIGYQGESNYFLASYIKIIRWELNENKKGKILNQELYQPANDFCEIPLSNFIFAQTTKDQYLLDFTQMRVIKEYNMENSPNYIAYLEKSKIACSNDAIKLLCFDINTTGIQAKIDDVGRNIRGITAYRWSDFFAVITVNSVMFYELKTTQIDKLGVYYYFGNQDTSSFEYQDQNKISFLDYKIGHLAIKSYDQSEVEILKVNFETGFLNPACTSSTNAFSNFCDDCSESTVISSKYKDDFGCQGLGGGVFGGNVVEKLKDLGGEDFFLEFNSEKTNSSTNLNDTFIMTVPQDGNGNLFTLLLIVLVVVILIIICFIWLIVKCVCKVKKTIQEKGKKIAKDKIMDLGGKAMENLGKSGVQTPNSTGRLLNNQQSGLSPLPAIHQPGQLAQNTNYQNPNMLGNNFGQAHFAPVGGQAQNFAPVGGQNYQAMQFRQPNTAAMGFQPYAAQDPNHLNAFEEAQ